DVVGKNRGVTGKEKENVIEIEERNELESEKNIVIEDKEREGDKEKNKEEEYDKMEEDNESNELENEEENEMEEDEEGIEIEEDKERNEIDDDELKEGEDDEVEEDVEIEVDKTEENKDKNKGKQLQDNIDKTISSLRTSTPSSTKGIAKTLDKTFSIQTVKFQDMYNSLNIIFQNIFSDLNTKISEIKDKVIESTNEQRNILAILDDIRIENTQSLIHHKITSYLNSENTDDIAFKFNLKKPPDNCFNREHIASEEKIESIKVFNRRKRQKNQKAKKRCECASFMSYDELGESLSDIEKVIKPEYASPEIS
ncbi:17764_t:CDS:2, partial [Racocetra persica]